MNIGPPVSIEIEPGEDDDEEREVSIVLYDDAGFCCGGVTVFPNGKIVANLISGNNIVISSDTYSPTK